MARCVIVFSIQYLTYSTPHSHNLSEIRRKNDNSTVTGNNPETLHVLILCAYSSPWSWAKLPTVYSQYRIHCLGIQILTCHQKYALEEEKRISSHIIDIPHTKSYSLQQPHL